MSKYIHNKSIFILGRVLLGILMFKYWFDLFLDREWAWMKPNLVPSFTTVPILAGTFGILGSIFSILILFGKFRQLACLLLWVLLNLFVYITPYAANVSLGYLSILLLALVFVPNEQDQSSTPWTFPKPILISLWLITGISYFDSAWDKINSPFWKDGVALQVLVENSYLTYDYFWTHLLKDSPALAKYLTWFVVLAEFAFLPLSLFRQTRIIAWASMVGVHIGILFTMGIYYITFGMLIFHIFLLCNINFLFTKTNSKHDQE